MIQRVEELSPELHFNPLGDPRVFQQRQIQVRQSRPAVSASSKVSIRTEGRQHKRVRIKPLRGFPQNHRACKGGIQ